MSNADETEEMRKLLLTSYIVARNPNVLPPLPDSESLEMAAAFMGVQSPQLFAYQWAGKVPWSKEWTEALGGEEPSDVTRSFVNQGYLTVTTEPKLLVLQGTPAEEAKEDVCRLTVKGTTVVRGYLRELIVGKWKNRRPWLLGKIKLVLGWAALAGANTFVGNRIDEWATDSLRLVREALASEPSASVAEPKVQEHQHQAPRGVEHEAVPNPVPPHMQMPTPATTDPVTAAVISVSVAFARVANWFRPRR